MMIYYAIVAMTIATFGGRAYECTIGTNLGEIERSALLAVHSVRLGCGAARSWRQFEV
jgi:hypothetical protein